MIKHMIRTFSVQPVNGKKDADETSLPSAPAALPAENITTDQKTLGRIRSAVRVLSMPPPHLFRALFLSARERVSERKKQLLRDAAEIKRESDAAMTRILLSGTKPPQSPPTPPTLLERLHQ